VGGNTVTLFSHAKDDEVPPWLLVASGLGVDLGVANWWENQVSEANKRPHVFMLPASPIHGLLSRGKLMKDVPAKKKSFVSFFFFVPHLFHVCILWRN